MRGLKFGPEGSWFLVLAEMQAALRKGLGGSANAPCGKDGLVWHGRLWQVSPASCPPRGPHRAASSGWCRCKGFGAGFDIPRPGSCLRLWNLPNVACLYVTIDVMCIYGAVALHSRGKHVHAAPMQGRGALASRILPDLGGRRDDAHIEQVDTSLEEWQGRRRPIPCSRDGR